MAIKDIVTTENKLLRRKSKRIDKIDNETLELIQDLKDTLYAANGVGLAAPQIGVLKRAFIIDLRDGNGPVILLNPKIIKKIGRYEDGEGCLSYPGYEGVVVRPRKVIVSGMNEKGQQVKYEASGLMARAICHETDHLDGILYMDIAKKMYKIPENLEEQINN